VGLVLGIVVGAGAVAAIAATDSGGAPKTRTTPTTVPARSKIVITVPNAPNGGATDPITVNAQLPPLNGRARGYRLAEEPRAGAIERLADAVGVHGDVQTDAGGWIVRQDNRLVRVQRAAGLPWFFSVLQGPCSMVPSEALPPVPPAGPTDCPEAEGPPNGPVRPPDFPGQDEALAAGMETLGRAGLGVSRPVIVDQGSSWHIEAAPLIGDMPTSGFGWTATVGPGKTVTAASGYLGTPVAAESYRLVGTAKGIERAKALSGGTVTGVREGLMLGRLGDSPYLVPAYLFELQGTAGAPPPIVAVPAVEDQYLA
jgi:hypothetical protein